MNAHAYVLLAASNMKALKEPQQMAAAGKEQPPLQAVQSESAGLAR
jgi:hypothetical protein